MSRFKALCPAHNDKNPSLSIAIRDGQLYLKCFAGCSRDAILAALGLPPDALYKRKDHIYCPPGKKVAEYVYTNDTGTPLYKVVRYEPKTFRPFVRTGPRSWKPGAPPPEKRVLFNLWKIASHPTYPVVFCEGEKDAISATLPMVCAGTAILGGAKCVWSDAYTAPLAGRTVIIVADCDEPGREFAFRCASKLYRTSEVTIVDLAPDRNDGYDISDWIAENGKAALTTLIQQAAAQTMPNYCKCLRVS